MLDVISFSTPLDGFRERGFVGVTLVYKIPYRRALGRVRTRAKESCIQESHMVPLGFGARRSCSGTSVLNHSTLEFRDFSKRAPGS